MKILTIAAHPDDEMLGCGGTMARLVQEGHNVSIAILGEGMTSRYPGVAQIDPQLLKTLHNDSHRAAGKIGVQNLSLCGLPDNRFDTIPLLDIVKKIEELISQFSPQVIYTHHGGDLNIDHVITHRAVLTATRPMVGQSVREIFAFEVASSTEWSFQKLESPFRPNVFLDISQTFEDKIKALLCYETEMRPFPHPRSPEAIRAIAQRWGSVVGVQYAEAFELIRSIR